MVKYSSETLDRSLYALSDPTRRAILARLTKAEITVSELAEPFDMSLAAVSKHLQVLERAKLIKRTKSGRTITCSATLQPLNEITHLLDQLNLYWSQQLTGLEEYLKKDLVNKGEKHGTTRHSANTSSKTRHKSKKS